MRAGLSLSSFNVLLGTEAGCLIDQGSCNVIIGHQAGCALTGGFNNILIGTHAGCELLCGVIGNLRIGCPGQYWLCGDVDRNVCIGGGLVDCCGCTGVANQVLNSTGSRIEWATPCVQSAVSCYYTCGTVPRTPNISILLDSDPSSILIPAAAFPNGRTVVFTMMGTWYSDVSDTSGLYRLKNGNWCSNALDFSNKGAQGTRGALGSSYLIPNYCATAGINLYTCANFSYCYSAYVTAHTLITSAS